MRQVEQQPEERAATKPRTTGQPASPSLLALQRTAGNRTVNALVADARREATPGTTPPPVAVQRGFFDDLFTKIGSWFRKPKAAANAGTGASTTPPPSTVTATATTTTTTATAPTGPTSGSGTGTVPSTEGTSPPVVRTADTGTPVVAQVPDPAPTTSPGSDTTATATTSTGPTTGGTTGGTPATGTTASPPTTAGPPATIAEALDKSGLTFKERIALAFSLFTPTLADIKGKVDGASQVDRDTVWSDATLMATIKSKLGAQDYLNFLVAVREFQPGIPAEGGAAHTKASDADKYIRDKLATYVVGAVTAGRQIEGEVAVVGSGDWDAAGIAHYGASVWNGGKKDAINGFVDSSGRVWIERNSGNAGTMVHEGLHKYSDGQFLTQIGFNANEGVTEWFTRKVGNMLTPPMVARGNYQPQWQVIDKLVTLVGEEKVAQAYFDGKITELGAEVTTKGGNWATFKTKVKAGDYAAATIALTPSTSSTTTAPTTGTPVGAGTGSP